MGNLIVFFIVIYLIILLLKSPTLKGKFGERLVSFCLDKYLDKRKYRILNDVMISDNMGGTTQIDHIVLSKYGIFVVETKNMRGWIYGDARSKTWTQVIYKKKTKFQNPFFQTISTLYVWLMLQVFQKNVFIILCSLLVNVY